MPAHTAPGFFAPAADEDHLGAWSPSSMPTVPRVGRARRSAGAGLTPTPWGPAPVGRAMTRRRPVVVWLVAVVTLGLGHVVWYQRIHREMAAFDRRRKVPVRGPALVMALLWPTIVAPLVSVAAAARRVADAQRAAGLFPTCRPGVAVVLAAALGLHTVYLQAGLNTVVDAYDAVPGTRVALRD